jgi:hypothetical protein
MICKNAGMTQYRSEILISFFLNASYSGGMPVGITCAACFFTCLPQKNLAGGFVIQNDTGCWFLVDLRRSFAILNVIERMELYHWKTQNRQAKKNSSVPF